MAVAMLIIGSVLLLLLVVLLALRLYINRPVTCATKNRLDGKTVVITGTTSGIGRAIALECARRGATVLMACRSKARTEALAAFIRRTTGSDRVAYAQVDLASLQSTHQFALALLRQHIVVDVLINNAGYMGPAVKTLDGLEQSFQVNYLGHYYLTRLLLARHLQYVATTGPARMRVINMASDSYRMGNADFDDVFLPHIDKYDIYRAYATSKLATVLFTAELNNRYAHEGVTSMAVHPGAVKTELMRHWPGTMGSLLRFAARLLFRTPDAGAQCAVYCAAAPETDVMRFGGKLLYDCTVLDAEPAAQFYGAGQRLWSLSARLCAMEDDGPTLNHIPQTAGGPFL